MVTKHASSSSFFSRHFEQIKGQYLVKNTTDIRIDVIFYD